MANINILLYMYSSSLNCFTLFTYFSHLLAFFPSLLLVINEFVLSVGDTKCNKLEASQIWQFEVASV